MDADEKGDGSTLTREIILRALQTLSDELGKQGVIGIPMRTQYLVEGLFEVGRI
jgi:hypothetical protein